MGIRCADEVQALMLDELSLQTLERAIATFSGTPIEARVQVKHSTTETLSKNTSRVTLLLKPNPFAWIGHW